jgi:hypothetical protein
LGSIYIPVGTVFSDPKIYSEDEDDEDPPAAQPLRV